MNNVVLVANPSHSTAREHRFWCQVTAALRRRGWHVVEVAMRLLPYTPGAISLTLPARLGEVNHCLRQLPLWRARDQESEWWSPGDERVQEDWEHRRWALEERPPATLLGLMRLAVFVDSVLDTLNPSLVLTTNKIDHNVVHFRRAAQARGIPAWIVERSPLDSIWLEPEGLFAESRIWRSYRMIDGEGSSAERNEHPALAQLIGNPQGFRRGEHTGHSEADLEGLPRPLVFLPMDNVLWTGWEQPHHPMRSVDSPLYPTPAVAMEDLATQVANLGGSLVVKPHPSCLAIRRDDIPSRAWFYDGALAPVMRRADIVACFNTKVAFPALAMSKPVVTLSPNPVAVSGATYHCRLASDVPARLAAALEGRDLTEKIDRFGGFVDWCASEYFYGCDEAEGGRGPQRFVDDILGSAREPRQEIAEERLEALVSCLRKGTGVRRIRPHEASPPEPRERRGPLWLVKRAARMLREEGPLELARRSASHLALRAGPAALKLLDRSRFDLREVKATKPHLLPYHIDWCPLEVSLDDLNHFAAGWTRGLGLEARLQPPTCLPAEIDRWSALKGNEAGRTLWIVGSGTLEHAHKALPRHARTLVLHAHRRPISWRPTYALTLDWATALAGGAKLPPVDRAMFLPQRFRGLVASDWIFWFGHAPEGIRFSSDVGRGLVYRDEPLEAALQIACHLGFAEIRVDVDEVPLQLQRWEELVEGLALHGCIVTSTGHGWRDSAVLGSSGRGAQGAR